MDSKGKTTTTALLHLETKAEEAGLTSQLLKTYIYKTGGGGAYERGGTKRPRLLHLQNDNKQQEKDIWAKTQTLRL